jgi:hypothetical protein
VSVTSKVAAARALFDSASRAGAPGSCVITGGTAQTCGAGAHPHQRERKRQPALLATDVTLGGTRGKRRLRGFWRTFPTNYGVGVF